jgi:multidrug resistance efflux pump
VPIRITIDRLPDDVRLISGMTATVVVEPASD